MSDSLRPHGLQHTRPPCLLPTSGVYSNSCPLSGHDGDGVHSPISSSIVPFSSCFQSFPASESFQMSQLLTSGGQSNGVSASASVPPMNTQDLLGVQGTLKSLLQHRSSKASIFQRSAFFMVQLSRPYMTIGKMITLTIQTFVGKVMSLLFNTLTGLS